MNGGGQESKRRAGTENVAGIVGFGKAAELALKKSGETQQTAFGAEKLFSSD
jgi:cysteine desulfurase